MAQKCGFSGNPDLYGLGIRLGIYLQWATAGAAYAMDLQNEASNVFEAYLLFCFAIIAALFTLTFTSQMHVIEVAIMLYLYFGGLLSVVYYVGYQSPTVRRTWRQFLLVLGWLVMGGYSAWFWLSGRKTNRFTEDACGTTLFLFAKLGPSHLNSLSKFFAVLSIISGLNFGFVAIPFPPRCFPFSAERFYLKREKIAMVHDLQAICSDLSFPVQEIDSMVKIIEDEYDRLASEHTISRVPTTAALRRVDSFDPRNIYRRNRTSRASSGHHIPWLSLLDIQYGSAKRAIHPATFTIIHGTISLYSMVGIELMLHWNKVGDIYTIRSVGQLIPFVIGLAGFLKIFYDAIYRYKGAKQHSSQKRHEQLQSISEGATDDVYRMHDLARVTTETLAGHHASMQAPDGRWQ